MYEFQTKSPSHEEIRHAHADCVTRYATELRQRLSDAKGKQLSSLRPDTNSPFTQGSYTCRFGTVQWKKNTKWTRSSTSNERSYRIVHHTTRRYNQTSSEDQSDMVKTDKRRPRGPSLNYLNSINQ